MEKDTQNDGSSDQTYRLAVVYYRFARKGHADHERKVADYFAKYPAVSVAGSFRETNPSTRPMLREAIDAARRESAAVLVAGEYRKDRTYEVICGTLTREGVPFVWLGSMWSSFFDWEEPLGKGDLILADGSIVPRERVLLLGSFRGYPAWETDRREGWDVLVEAPAAVTADPVLLGELEEFVRSFDQAYAEEHFDLEPGELDDCQMDWAEYRGDRKPHHWCVLTTTGEWTTLGEAPEVLLRHMR
jgi:hypothetical protein